MDELHSPPVAPVAPADTDRLDSWKEIAAFLKRDVRTVQRWEKQAGLPVHRHSASRLRTAYAYRSELDEWWRRHPENPEGRPPATPAFGVPAAAGPRVEGDSLVPAARPRRRWIATAAVAVAFAGAAAIGWWQLAGARPGTPETDSVPVQLVTASLDIDGDTASLAHLINESVERTVAAVPRVSSVSSAELARIRLLMRIEPEGELSLEQAREVAVRSGTRAYVLAARVHRVQSEYVAAIEVVDPAEGTIVRTVEGQAAEPGDLLARIERMTGEAVRDLPVTAAAAPPLERLSTATTSSLDALRLYSHAVRAGRRRQWAAAELLARRAVALDDRFASAYATMAWAVCNQGRPLDDCLAPARRALDLSRDTSDHEIYFITGTYYTLTGDVTKAVAAFEALLRIHPKDVYALDRLIDCYWRAGRVRDAAEHTAVRASQEPDDFYANVRAAQAMQISGDEARAQQFLSRSRSLISHATLGERPFWGAWLTLLPAFDRWMAGESQGALTAIATVAGGLDTKVGRERDGFATAVGFSYLALGRLKDAEAAFRSASAPTRQIDLAMLALAVGDQAKARDWLLQVRDQRSVVPALFAEAGLTEDAEAGLSRYFGPEHGNGISALARGLIAQHHGRTLEAADALEHSVELLRYSGEPEYFMAVEALARVWIARGEPERAAALLADAVKQRARTYGSARWSAAFWIRLNAQLIALDQKLGRPDDVSRLRRSLAQSLAYADRAHPDAQLVQTLASRR
jgi:tetratricopeptide (TPR) repeat protein